MLENIHYTFENPHRESTSVMPKSIFFLGYFILKYLKRKYKHSPSVDFEVAEGLFFSLKNGHTINAETGQMPMLALAPKIRAKAWWQKEDDPELQKIETTLSENSEEIIQEYFREAAKGPVTKPYRAAARYGEKGQAWTGYQLSHIMGVKQEVKQRFPVTAKTIESCGFRILSSDFLELAPGGRLPIHTDATNLVLACQFAIKGSKDAVLSISKTPKKLITKSIVFFDQSFPHTAWNYDKEKRVVLLLSILHPDISKKEFEIAKEFVRKTRRTAYVFFPIIVIDFFIQLVIKKLLKK